MRVCLVEWLLIVYTYIVAFLLTVLIMQTIYILFYTSLTPPPPPQALSPSPPVHAMCHYKYIILYALTFEMIHFIECHTIECHQALHNETQNDSYFCYLH